MNTILSVEVQFDGVKLRAVPKVHPAWRMLSDKQVSLRPPPSIHCSSVNDLNGFELEGYLFSCVRALVAVWELARFMEDAEQMTLPEG